jgi:hypothetical protein
VGRSFEGWMGVTTVAFLIDATGQTPVDLGPAVAEALASLGVTGLAVYRDPKTVCVVLEGWAFDASSSTAAAAIIGFAPDARTLRPVMRTALRANV